MTRIAIISDIHGNLEALKAVLKDIKERKVEHIFCLGDIIHKGVHSSECIKLVRENCDVVVQGNWEAKLFRNLEELDAVMQERVKWNLNNLSSDELSYIKDLPYSYEFYLSGSLVRLFHSTPFHIEKLVLPIHKEDIKYNMFLPSQNTVTQNMADVVVFGHVHTPFCEQLYNRTLINAGSVGNSLSLFSDEEKNASNMEVTRANYLILEGNLNQKEYGEISFQFVKVPYDIEKELDSTKFNIEKENYELELRKGRYRDMEKMNEYLKQSEM